MGDRPAIAACDSMTTVFVTGFGPFGEHTVNASWVAVQELAKLKLENVELHIREIPVEYAHVKNRIPELWKEINPQLVIHVGVSHIADSVELERNAHSFGYHRGDICGCTPDESDIHQECLHTRLNLEEICEFAKENGCCCCLSISEDAGRYLCEYIYFTSMKMHKAPVLFVHVPCLDKPYSKEQLAASLKIIIKGAVQQVRT